MVERKMAHVGVHVCNIECFGIRFYLFSVVLLVLVIRKNGQKAIK